VLDCDGRDVFQGAGDGVRGCRELLGRDGGLPRRWRKYLSRDRRTNLSRCRRLLGSRRRLWDKRSKSRSSRNIPGSQRMKNMPLYNDLCRSIIREIWERSTMCALAPSAEVNVLLQ
jgi:hypothetical protein